MVKKRKNSRDLPQIAIRVRAEWLEQLDQLARESGWLLNRSDFVREAIEQYLARKSADRKRSPK